jgi:hypothetical protein
MGVHMKAMKYAGMAGCLSAWLALGGAVRAEEPAAVPAGAEKHQPGDSGETITVTGEIVDLACYIDHGAQGDKHRSCAQTCIESGLPVGIKTPDGKTYIVIGEHEPLNAKLAPLAAKTVTLKGKLARRDGLSMIANAEIVK